MRHLFPVPAAKPLEAQACLRLLWKPDFSQQIVINQGLKAVASYRTPRRLRRGMQKVCGIWRVAGAPSKPEIKTNHCHDLDAEN
jgi:hypothetical protein